MRLIVCVLEGLIIPREIMQCSPGRHGEGEEHEKRRSIVMQEIEDLEEKVGTEKEKAAVAQEAVEAMKSQTTGSDLRPIDDPMMLMEVRELCRIASVARDELNELNDRVDILMGEFMGKKESRTALDLVDRTLSTRERRLEVHDISEALSSVSMDIVSAQQKMLQAEEVIDEIQHRLDDLLVRLKEAEKEDDR